MLSPETLTQLVGIESNHLNRHFWLALLAAIPRASTSATSTAAAAAATSAHDGASASELGLATLAQLLLNQIPSHGRTGRHDNDEENQCDPSASASGDMGMLTTIAARGSHFGES